MNLVELEEIVQSGVAGFLEAGQALQQIRDRRLYREGHATWQVYCRERWRLSATHANRLIQAAGQFGRRLTPMGVKFPPASRARGDQLVGTPANERQARAITQFRRPLAPGLPPASPADLRRARLALSDMTPEEKFAQAQAAEAQALRSLQKIDRERVLAKIERLCGRLKVLHATLPTAAMADQALTNYLAAVRG